MAATRLARARHMSLRPRPPREGRGAANRVVDAPSPTLLSSSAPTPHLPSLPLIYRAAEPQPTDGLFSFVSWLVGKQQEEKVKEELPSTQPHEKGKSKVTPFVEPPLVPWQDGIEFFSPDFKLETMNPYDHGEFFDKMYELISRLVVKEDERYAMKMAPLPGSNAQDDDMVALFIPVLYASVDDKVRKSSVSITIARWDDSLGMYKFVKAFERYVTFFKKDGDKKIFWMRSLALFKVFMVKLFRKFFFPIIRTTLDKNTNVKYGGALQWVQLGKRDMKLIHKKKGSIFSPNAIHIDLSLQGFNLNIDESLDSMQSDEDVWDQVWVHHFNHILGLERKDG